MSYDTTGDAGFSTPLSDAIVALAKQRPSSEILRMLCHVAFQAEYYRTKAPMLTGVNLAGALDELAGELMAEIIAKG